MARPPSGPSDNPDYKTLQLRVRLYDTSSEALMWRLLDNKVKDIIMPYAKATGDLSSYMGVMERFYIGGRTNRQVAKMNFSFDSFRKEVAGLPQEEGPEKGKALHNIVKKLELDPTPERLATLSQIGFEFKNLTDRVNETRKPLDDAVVEAVRASGINTPGPAPNGQTVHARAWWEIDALAQDIRRNQIDEQVRAERAQRAPEKPAAASGPLNDKDSSKRPEQDRHYRP
ncbi:MAG: hypothetical protein HY053_02000 [Proteobacteria bacterium]|nr:hypothetical protein [Pseudomonadota bacterium]